MDICMDYPEGIMKLPIYDASALVKGQLLKWGADAGTYNGTVLNSLIDVANTGENAFAVLQETPSSVAGNRQTPTLYQATVRLLNNPTIIKCYYDLAVGTDLDVSSSTSTIITTAANDDDVDGGWVYLNSDTGVGQLRYIKASSATTMTVNTAFTITPDSSTDFILIRPEGQPLDGIAFNSTFDKILPVLNETDASKTIILKNFVQGPMGTKELNITANPDLECDGLDGRGVRFFSLIILGDGIWAAGI